MKYFILSVILLTCLTVCAQSGTVTISGIVTDKETNEPLISVPILLEGTTTGTLTNIDGRYTLKVPENGTLIFRYAEYESMEVSIAETSCIDIALEPVPKNDSPIFICIPKRVINPSLSNISISLTDTLLITKESAVYQKLK